MQIVGRSVERINDPHGIGLTLHTRLLGEDRVVGIVVLDDLDDGGLGGAIDIADKIVMPFLLNLELVQLVEVPDEDGAATACCHHSHIL